MMGPLDILIGPACSGKTSRVLAAYAEQLELAWREERLGSTLLIVPTQTVQRELTIQLARRMGRACLAPNIQTFEVVAEHVLDAAGRPATAISPGLRRRLLIGIVRELSQQGKLEYFSRVAQKGGFLDVIAGTITELKRDEIWPIEYLELIEKSSRTTSKDREIGTIYARYQDVLNAERWYDGEGKFWLARTALTEGHLGDFRDLDLLAVDGFADFTHTQYEILATLMAAARRSLLTLPGDENSDRKDIFDSSARALQRIRREIKDQAPVTVTYLPPVDPSPSQATIPPAIINISSRLFSPRATTHVDERNGAGLEILSAVGAAGEMEGVVQRIKEFLSAGTPPRDIVVGVRGVDQNGARWLRAMKEAGVPCSCSASQSLASTAVIKRVLSLLSLELEDWSFNRLSGLCNSPWFLPEGTTREQLKTVPTVLREHRLHAGRSTILKALERTRERDERFGIALEALKSINQLFEPTRKKQSFEEWISAIAYLADHCEAVGTPHVKEPQSPSADRDIWKLGLGGLRLAAKADRPLPHTEGMTLHEFYHQFIDLLSCDQLPPEGTKPGCVRIFEMDHVRNLDVPILFLVGLSEATFPSHRKDDCLFSDADRRELNLAGWNIPHRQSQLREEKLLFYSIVTRARRHLVLSYPRVNDKGQEVFPSPFVTAVRSLFDPATYLVRDVGGLDPIPVDNRPRGIRDGLLVAMKAARDHESFGWLRGLFEIPSWRATGSNLLSAVNAASNRFQTRGLTPDDGQLENHANLEWCAKHFGPAHEFSVSALQEYAKCPFRFAMNRIFKIDELPAPDTGKLIVERGQSLHTALAKASHLIFNADLDVKSDQLREDLVQSCQRVSRRRPTYTPLQQAVNEVELKIQERTCETFTRQERDYEIALDHTFGSVNRRIISEVSFGGAVTEEWEEGGSYPVLRLEIEGESYRLNGKIDRIDVVDDLQGPRFIVIDYKSSKSAAKFELDLIASGETLQLVVYLIAIETLGIAGPNARPHQLSLWTLEGKGFVRLKRNRPQFTLEEIDPVQLAGYKDAAKSAIASLVRNIRQGSFAPERINDDCCRHCPYARICRTNHLQSLKQQLDKFSDWARQKSTQLDKSRSRDSDQSTRDLQFTSENEVDP